MRDVVVVGGDPEERGVLEPLWRDVLGRRLRALRLERGERLVETAARAGISPQYLSEIERGRKEPSSEMVAAIAGALRTRLVDLTAGVAEELRRSTAAGSHSPCPAAPGAPASAAPASSSLDFGLDAAVSVLAFAA